MKAGLETRCKCDVGKKYGEVEKVETLEKMRKDPMNWLLLLAVVSFLGFASWIRLKCH